MTQIPPNTNWPGTLVAAIIATALLFTSGNLVLINSDLSSADPRYQMYLWDYARNQDFSIDAHVVKGDPLQSVWRTWTDYHYSRNGREATTRLNKIISRWDLHKNQKLTYEFRYNDLAPGWWSGMDGLMLPWLLVMVGKDTGNSAFIELGKKVLEAALKSPEEGGVLWPDAGNGCWISEYSWIGMRRNDEYYVLNGHLFALGALYELAAALDDNRARAAYACAMRGAKALSNRFIAPGQAWALYMLKPATIDPGHYLIYEIIQFDSLYAMTKDEFYAIESYRRRALIRQQFPLYAISSAEGNQVFASVLGAPHPYNLDIYSGVVDCQEKNRRRRVSMTTGSISRSDFIDSAFATAKVKNFHLNCKFSTQYNGQRHFIYSTEEFIQIDPAKPIVPVSYRQESVILDARPQYDGSIVLDPSIVTEPEGPAYLNTTGRVTLAFPIRPVGSADLVVLEIESTHRLRNSISFQGSGKSITRYGLPIDSGRKQYVVLSTLGFDGGMDMNSLESITLYFETSDLREAARIRLGELYVVNQYELYSLVKKTGIPMLIQHDKK